jgi:hypothetical protein
VCSAVSYFSTLLGSIIGAGRLSFRVRNGTGRFPAAMAAVTVFTRFWAIPNCPPFRGGEVLFGGGVQSFDCVVDVVAGVLLCVIFSYTCYLLYPHWGCV